jgi:hypothetical protein
MIATNALLSAAFSLIAAFTNTINLQRDAPTSVDDLQRFVIGGVRRPTDVYLATKQGAEYWIANGVVYSFACKDSYFRLQDSKLLDRFRGEATANSNEVVQIARNTLQKLARRGDPLSGCKLWALTGNAAPFYRLEWAAPPNDRSVAAIEIDARTRRVVYLYLRDADFLDPQMELKIRDAVYTDERPQIKPDPNYWPEHGPEAAQPSIEYVKTAIQNAKEFIRRMNFGPQSQLNFDDVDWSRSALGMYSLMSYDAPNAQIIFKNGACISAINGVVYDFCAGDSYGLHALSQTEQRRWTGPVTEKWQDLAQKLEQALTTRFQIPRSEIDNLEINPPLTNNPTLSPEPFLRQGVSWYPRPITWPKPYPSIMAEFDMTNGLLKHLSLANAGFLTYLAKFQQSFIPQVATVHIAPGGWVRQVRENRGLFTVTRDSCTSLPLTINYTVGELSGSYEGGPLKTNYLTIPAGFLNTNIRTDRNLFDFGTNSNLSIVLTLIPPPSNHADLEPKYLIGALRSATNQVLRP